MARAVKTPCPISLRGMTTPTVPSASTRTQPFRATGSDGDARPSRLAGGATAQPTSSAPAAPDADSRKARRRKADPLGRVPTSYNLRAMRARVDRRGETRPKQETSMTLPFVRRAAVGLAVGLCAMTAFAANVLSVKEKVE